MNSGRDGAQPEQQQPEERRRDPPRSRALPLLEELAEDRDERSRERGIGDESADEVGDLERDRERVDGAAGAEVVGDDDLAHEPEHARETGCEGEDRRRPREPPAPVPLLHAASIGTRSNGPGPNGTSRRGRPPPPTTFDPSAEKAHRIETHSCRICAESGPGALSGPRSGSGTITPPAQRAFSRMPNIKQQKKRVRVAAQERLREPALPLDGEDAHEAARDGRRGGRLGPQSPRSTSSFSAGSIAPSHRARSTGTPARARRRRPPGSPGEAAPRRSSRSAAAASRRRAPAPTRARRTGDSPP